MKLFNVLLRKELITQLFGEGKTDKRKDILGQVLSALISVLFLALFVFLFVAFQSKFVSLNLEYEVLIIFVAVAIIAQVVLSLAKTANVLYGGTDAKVVLPLPISNLTMLSAKLTALWVKELINSCFFLAPIFIAYGVMADKSIFYYPSAVISVALASLFTVSVTTLLSPVFVKVKNFFRKYPVLILAISLVFLSVLFVAYSELLSVISEMLLGNRLHFIFNKTVANNLRKIAGYLFYAKQIGDFLNGNFLAFLIDLAVTAVLVVLGYLASSKFYLAYLKSNTARQSKATKVKPNKIRSTTASLIVKELTEIFRNPMYLFSYLSVVLTLPALCFLTVGVLNELIIKLLGSDFIIPFAILILVMFSCVCNTFAGDVISREESRIMIVKTIPVQYKLQVTCKVVIAYVIAFVSDLLSVVLLIASGTLELWPGLMVFVITFVATVASITHLVSKDIDRPSIANASNENPNVSMAVVRALAVSFGLGLICFILYGAATFFSTTGHEVFVGIADFANALGVYGIMAIVLVLAVIDAALGFLKLLRNLDKRMRRIKI